MGDLFGDADDISSDEEERKKKRSEGEDGEDRDDREERDDRGEDEDEDVSSIVYTGKILPPFYFRPLTIGRIQNWANWIIYKGLCKEIW